MKAEKKIKSDFTNQLLKKQSKLFGLGGDLPPRRDVRRFVKWPRYIRVQRRRRILYQSIKVPSIISQLSRPLDKNTNHALFCLLHRYSKETKTIRKARHRKEVETGVIYKKRTPLPIKSVCFGINHVTRLVEMKKAALVVIAGDVEPIEIVLWLPCLCQKMNVPYVIVRGKARLGNIVHRKKITSLAIKEVNQNDDRELAEIIRSTTRYKTQTFQSEMKQLDSQLCQSTSKRAQNQIPGLI